METEQSNNDGYFTSYEDLEIHRLMLTDNARNKSYWNAISDNADSIKNKTVLDVGAGTGILSVMCARVGAKKVYAVEASDTYKIAEETTKENNFENTIKVIHCRVEDVTEQDLPEKVDVIVSEWMGFYLFHEGMLDSVIMAREKFLKPDGLMFPETAALYASPCSVPAMYEHWENVQGVSMRFFAKNLRDGCTKKPLTEIIAQENVLSESEVVCWIDLRDVTLTDVNEIKLRHLAVANRPGRYQGIALWFTCTFPCGKNGEPVVLTTEPGEEDTHWKQTVIVLPVETAVEKGSPICYDLLLKRSPENPRRYALEVEMLDPAEVEHPELCMCHMTKCILVRAMLERYQKGDDGMAIDGE